MSRSTSRGRAHHAPSLPAATAPHSVHSAPSIPSAPWDWPGYAAPPPYQPPTPYPMAPMAPMVATGWQPPFGWQPAPAPAPAPPATAYPLNEVGQLLRESEARTMRVFEDLRTEVRAGLARTMTAERVTDHWAQDAATQATVARQLHEHDAAIERIERVLPTLPTRDDLTKLVTERLAEIARERPTTLQVEHVVADVVKRHTAGFVTEDKLTGILETHRKTQYKELRTLLAWALGVLVSLTLLGFIHPANIFHP